MNYIKRWMERRRNRRESDRISERQHKEATIEHRTKQLKEHVGRVKDDLIKVGFCPMMSNTVDDDVAMSTFMAVGPDTKPYRVEVYHKGGYDIIPINRDK